MLPADGLTKEDVSYLRRADDVYAINIDGQNFLRVVKRGRYDDAFDSDKRVDIPVGGNGLGGWFTNAWAFPWHTLRVGDLVWLDWRPDGGMTGYLREHAPGLHADLLFVEITRGKQRPARYLVETSICPDNSARMCRSAELVGRSFG